MTATASIFLSPVPELVVGYIRVSGRGQVDGDGPDRQRDSVKKFCTAHKLSYHAEFFEKSVSGTVEAMTRPAFAQLLEFIDERRPESGRAPVKAIVVERMDRLARDLMVSEFLLAECRRRGIKVYSADQGVLIDMTGEGADPTRVLIRQILGALAQWEKTMLVSKLRSARERKKAATGRCEGKKPYGTRPGERDLINLAHNFRSVLDEWNQPMEYVVIANHFNDAGFKTRHGKRWNSASVRHMVETTQPSKIIEIED